MATKTRRAPLQRKWTPPRTSIHLTPSEQRILQHLARVGHTGAWLAARVRCVLLAARGLGTKTIARTLGRTPCWVHLWRERFARLRLNGLTDRVRGGRPAHFSPRRAS